MRALLTATLLSAVACSGGPAAPVGDVSGTWGGDNAGLIVTDGIAHVHIGCTAGDVDGPIRPDASGRFDVTGTYEVDAYPVGPGVTHPARFTGRVEGRAMMLTVALTDTARAFGPVTLVYGREPVMGPCPICRDGNAGNRSGAAGAGSLRMERHSGR